MATDVIMPRYGWTMTEGKIVQWLKMEGEEVKAGKPLLIIESEKTEIEVEAEVSGILLKIYAPEGTSVPVTSQIAMIGQLGEPVADVMRTSAPNDSPEVLISSKAERKQPPSELRSSPRAKKLAQQYKIDLKDVHGTGPDGFVVADDIMNLTRTTSASQPSSGPNSMTITKKLSLTGRRKIIAERMAASSRNAAAVTITMEVDASDAAQLLRKFKEEQQLDVTFTDFIARAVVVALQEHQLLNSIWLNDEIVIPDEINLGIAVADEEGLIVPVLRHAGEKSLLEISAARRDIVKRVGEGKLSPDEASGSTFTISNLGMYGVQFFTPILNLPENAILGVGQLTEQPAVLDGKICVRTILPLSLSFDHRAIDGAPASLFLKRVKELVEKPQLLT
ncbi:MAG: dihydrolipoamide acetyltransferase family protein [Candidatus Bathyarchaeia archaeon]|jgi:pyruvate dehydrogenase E2 component (dihydrolipoamide acetyltransferase)